eukprot:jgi/Tetstr1/438274/TSEL_026843.t1
MKGMSLRAVRPAAASRQAVRPVARVVCKAQVESKVNKAAAAAATLASTVVAHPAFALVDERLNGDGTGKILGVNDSALGWVILGMFTLIWTQFYAAQKDVDPSAKDDEDSGLTL